MPCAVLVSSTPTLCCQLPDACIHNNYLQIFWLLFLTNFCIFELDSGHFFLFVANLLFQNSVDWVIVVCCIETWWITQACTRMNGMDHRLKSHHWWKSGHVAFHFVLNSSNLVLKSRTSSASSSPLKNIAPSWYPKIESKMSLDMCSGAASCLSFVITLLCLFTIVNCKSIVRVVKWSVSRVHQFQIGYATLSFAVDERNSAIFPGDMVEVDSLVVYLLTLVAGLKWLIWPFPWTLPPCRYHILLLVLPVNTGAVGGSSTLLWVPTSIISPHRVYCMGV